MRGSLPLLCVALWVMEACGAALKGPKRKSKLASVNDVNVLLYGVLQFGDTLNQVFQNTGHRMTQINTSLLNNEGALQQLKQDAVQATHEEEQLRDTLSHLQMQSAGLNMQAAQMRTMLQNVEEEEMELQNQVTSLEKTFERSAPNLRKLKDMVLQQSNALKALVGWMQEQRQILEDHEQQLTHMQRLTET
ncbi:hypothetical protein AGOR_G00224740 [Albula goreensis]|uniref:Uncharacterized protein n=1 Tax=Albula goreensis TaxID=1534307 RepID=A0A8T3CGT5_9TELE|nr:hypothetical protein AGOR_G00224740 [Albula goreensis]